MADLSIDQQLAIAEVELKIAENIADLDESIEWADDDDRALVITMLAICYVQGYYDAKGEQPPLTLRPE